MVFCEGSHPKTAVIYAWCGIDGCLFKPCKLLLVESWPYLKVDLEELADQLRLGTAFFFKQDRFFVSNKAYLSCVFVAEILLYRNRMNQEPLQTCIFFPPNGCCIGATSGKPIEKLVAWRHRMSLQCTTAPTPTSSIENCCRTFGSGSLVWLWTLFLTHRAVMPAHWRHLHCSLPRRTLQVGPLVLWNMVL